MKTASSMALDLIPTAKESLPQGTKNPLQRSPRKAAKADPMTAFRSAPRSVETQTFQQTLQTARQGAESPTVKEKPKTENSPKPERAESAPQRKTEAQNPTEKSAPEQPQGQPQNPSRVHSDQASESEAAEASQKAPAEKGQPTPDISGESLFQSPLPLEALQAHPASHGEIHLPLGNSEPLTPQGALPEETVPPATPLEAGPAPTQNTKSPALREAAPSEKPQGSSSAPPSNPITAFSDVRVITDTPKAEVKDALKSALKEIMARQKPEMDQARPLSEGLKAAEGERPALPAIQASKSESGPLHSVNEIHAFSADLLSSQPLSLKATGTNDPAIPANPGSSPLEAINIQRTSTLTSAAVKVVEQPIPMASPAISQVDKSITWLLKQQEKGAEIQLNPEHLGRVTIRLQVDGDEVHARLWASEATTVPILQEHRHALEQSLREQGLSLGSFDLQQGNRDGTKFDHHSKPASVAHEASEDASEPKPRRALPDLGGAHLLECFA